MALEAKRAAKLEKKLKTLLGGYQVKYLTLPGDIKICDSIFRVEVKL